MADERGLSFKIIGQVRNDVKQPMRDGWEKVVSEIVIDSRLTEALDGIEEFSHIIVLYWMHRAVNQRELPFKVHPRGNKNLPLVGLFATRSPQRPNPVGKATVRLLQRRENILTVRGLDAIDGTPVIDVKPYLPGYDSVADAKAPPWAIKQ